jgi:hypothetical protein
VEFAVVAVRRSLDLSENYYPVKVGNLQVGLQTIKEDYAEIEVQGPEGIEQASVPIGAAVIVQSYTFINRDVGVILPAEKKRRSFFGRKEKLPPNGMMEAILDVRWGDQSLVVEEPEKNAAYDFMLVRQYEIVNDRPMVYNNQDVLQFGEMRLEIGDRVEEGSRNYRKPRNADFVVRFDDDEPESWQIRLNGKYHRKERYRVMVTSYDFYNSWYQAYGISVVYGRPKDEIDETDESVAEGLDVDTFVESNLSKTRLDEARTNPDEEIFNVGESKNIGKVAIKLMELKPGRVKLMFLAPKVKVTTLEHGEVFDFGRWDVSLVGVHGEQAILRVVEED